MSDDNKSKLTEYEKASAMLAHGFKNFNKITQDISQKKALRTIRKLVFEPLEEVDLVHKEEKALYAFFKDMLYYKNKVVEYVANEIEKNKKGETNEQN